MTLSLHRELRTISIPMQINDSASAQRSRTLTTSLHRELKSISITWRVWNVSLHRELKTISIDMQIDDCASAQRAEEPLYSHAEC